MSKHTPGPWTVTGPNDRINQTGIGRRLPSGANDPIACAYGIGPETAANANLIAAAPDLLAVLRMICDSDMLFSEPIERAMLAAIAKAEPTA